MRSKRTIGKKLMMSFGGLLALTVGLGVFSLVSLQRLGNSLDETVNKMANRADLGRRMSTSTWIMRASQRGVVMFSQMNSPEKVRKNDELFRGETRRLEDLIGEYRPLISTERGRQLIGDLERDLVAWQPVYDELAQRCAKQQFDGNFDALLDNTILMEIGRASCRERV